MILRNLCCRLLTGFLFALAACAHAEITTDGSLGPALDLPGPDFHINAGLGQQHGANLFHSFRDFHIRQGESATFTGPDSVANIISRVTGGEASEINGVLRSEIPAADVYLINPAGLMFGPEAALDVPAGFHAGSTDYVKLADGAEFHGDLAQVSRFSVVAPVAFGFLEGTHGTVTVTGADKSVGLRVKEDQTLSLAGREIDISQNSLISPRGQIRLTAVQGVTTVGFEDNTPLPEGGMIRMTDQAKLDVSGEGGGAVFIRGGRFEIRNSEVLSLTLGDTDGQEIQIQVTTLEVRDRGIISTSTLGPGKGGSLTIHARDLEMADGGGVIAASTRGQGEGGSLTINADNHVKISGKETDVFARATEGSSGDAGDLSITTGSLEVLNGGKISTSTRGTGKGGSLSIYAHGDVRISRGNSEADTGVFAETFHGNSGDAGNLVITTPRMEVVDGGIVSVSTHGQGHGGTLTIHASDSVLISGKNRTDTETGVSARTARGSSGDAGDLTITTGRLQVLDKGLISAVTKGQGKGGNLIIHTGDLEMLERGVIAASTQGPGKGGSLALYVDGTVQLYEHAFIFARTTPGSTGDAGRLTIKTQCLEVMGGGIISTSTQGSGQGGSLLIDADDYVQINKKGSDIVSGIFAQTTHKQGGDAGNLAIKTGSLRVFESGVISASTDGAGKGGSVDIHSNGALHLSGSEIKVVSTAEHGGVAGNIRIAGVEITLDRGAEVTSRTEGADGGRIEIITPAYLYLDRSTVETRVKAAQGNGGNIAILPGFIVLDNGRINANAYEGNGGRIDIRTHGVYQFDHKPLAEVITATSEQGGIDGEITLASPDVDVSSSLTTLPTTFSDEAELQQSPCSAVDAAKTSRFITSRCRSGVPVRGRGDLLPPAAILD